MARKLIVEIVGDSRSYERALNKSASSTKQFGNALGAANPKLGKLNQLSNLAGGGMLYAAGAATGLAFAIGAKSVAAASNLNEQLSRTEVVLGDAAEATIEWSETTAESMGISQRAALAAVGTFAGLFQTVGVQRQMAADLSKSLVQLAADLASLQDSSPEEALIALRSGLAGEAEPLRRFNIFLTEARVSQQALIETGKDNIKSLTQQEKTMARYTLIMKDSILAQGNFELTSGGLANQQRKLRAQIDNLSTQLGAVLVPSVTAVVGAMNDAITAGKDLAGVVQALAALPGVEIPVKLVSNVAGGRGGEILKHIVLGGISPLALGITIGKEISDGVRQGFDGSALLGDPKGVQPGVGGEQRAAARGQRAAAEARTRQDAANVKAGQAIVEQILRQNAGQKSLNRELAESETRAAHLKELIRADPTNLKLQQRLTAELKKQNGIREQQASISKQNAAEAKQASEDAAAAARAAVFAALDLGEAQAQLTKGLQDNLAAAKTRESTLRRLVSLNRDDLDLQNQLVQATIARRDIEQQINEQREERVKAAQFKELGLTAEGDKPTPGVGSLLKRATTLQQQVKGTILDTDKTRSELKEIVAFLRRHLDGAKKDVREAILAMLNGISEGFDDKKGPLTKGAGLNTKKVLEGLGLSAEETDELRSRLSSVSDTGRVLAGPGGGTATARARAGGRGGEPPIFVESHTTINLDGQRVANVVTKQQQKTRRRNPPQKRGQNARR